MGQSGVRELRVVAGSRPEYQAIQYVDNHQSCTENCLGDLRSNQSPIAALSSRAAATGPAGRKAGRREPRLHIQENIRIMELPSPAMERTTIRSEDLHRHPPTRQARGSEAGTVHLVF